MDKGGFFNELSPNSSIYEEDLLRETLHQPSLSSLSDSIINTTTTADAGGASVTTTTVSSLSSGASQSKHDSPSSGHASFCDKPAKISSHQSTYILSFDKSMVIPATANEAGGYEKHEAANTRASSLKRTPENNESESKVHQKTKKSRSSSETLDRITSDRKRRQELSQKFIALSATIPGLKKIDKSSVLSEANHHATTSMLRIKIIIIKTQYLLLKR
ncbi:hypothetical protein QN277_022615 [Acacia crassicarpa]|uniref:BHLH domain-containing protein n=1 Tax=Acacia crassicarpa TaxID=499986 RepID=A0AAE1JI86_9FABA|nr:hypothetical protein QN277_022615 [Acacia crassicarpa]